MTDYLSEPFDWNSAELVSVHDELPLWSAISGLLLLDHVPLAGEISVLDVGCGAGFPLLELAQRLGPRSSVVGLDPWEAALKRARTKARVLGIYNVEIVQGDAAKMPFEDARFDLIVSNLGVNNLADPVTALGHCYRVMRPGGHICLTTNLRGHMKEFYDQYAKVLGELGMSDALRALATHIDHRITLERLSALLRQTGFIPRRSFEQTVSLRYASGAAMLRHAFIRGAFLEAWRKVVTPQTEQAVFTALEARLNQVADERGELTLTVPLAYLEAVKIR